MPNWDERMFSKIKCIFWKQNTFGESSFKTALLVHTRPKFSQSMFILGAFQAEPYRLSILFI